MAHRDERRAPGVHMAEFEAMAALVILAEVTGVQNELRQLRLQQSKTLADIGRQFGVSKSLVSGWERDPRVRLEGIQAAASALGYRLRLSLVPTDPNDPIPDES